MANAAYDLVLEIIRAHSACEVRLMDFTAISRRWLGEVNIEDYFAKVSESEREAFQLARLEKMQRILQCFRDCNEWGERMQRNCERIIAEVNNG